MKLLLLLISLMLSLSAEISIEDRNLLVPGSELIDTCLNNSLTREEQALACFRAADLFRGRQKSYIKINEYYKRACDLHPRKYCNYYEQNIRPIYRKK